MLTNPIMEGHGEMSRDATGRSSISFLFDCDQWFTTAIPLAVGYANTILPSARQEIGKQVRACNAPTSSGVARNTRTHR
jgi:hypothetical protein